LSSVFVFKIPLEFIDTLLESFDLRRFYDLLIDPNRFVPALGHTPSPMKQREEKYHPAEPPTKSRSRT